MNMNKTIRDVDELDMESRRLLITIAQESVAAAVEKREWEYVLPATSPLAASRAAFVTLRKQNELRGCIGHIQARMPLYLCVSDVARAAAIYDTRFLPVSEKELKDIRYEISVLTNPEPVSPDAVVVGEHGLMIRRGGYQGVLLPQVPVERDWDRKTFLSQTCRKAGLPQDAWTDDETEILGFRAIVFSDADVDSAP